MYLQSKETREYKMGEEKIHLGEGIANEAKRP